MESRGRTLGRDGRGRSIFPDVAATTFSFRSARTLMGRTSEPPAGGRT